MQDQNVLFDPSKLYLVNTHAETLSPNGERYSSFHGYIKVFSYLQYQLLKIGEGDRSVIVHLSDVSSMHQTTHIESCDVWSTLSANEQIPVSSDTPSIREVHDVIITKENLNVGNYQSSFNQTIDLVDESKLTAKDKVRNMPSVLALKKNGRALDAGGCGEKEMSFSVATLRMEMKDAKLDLNKFSQWVQYMKEICGSYGYRCEHNKARYVFTYISTKPLKQLNASSHNSTQAKRGETTGEVSSGAPASKFERLCMAAIEQETEVYRELKQRIGEAKEDVKIVRPVFVLKQELNKHPLVNADNELRALSLLAKCAERIGYSVEQHHNPPTVVFTYHAAHTVPPPTPKLASEQPAGVESEVATTFSYTMLSLYADMESGRETYNRTIHGLRAEAEEKGFEGNTIIPVLNRIARERGYEWKISDDHKSISFTKKH